MGLASADTSSSDSVSDVSSSGLSIQKRLDARDALLLSFVIVERWLKLLFRRRFFFASDPSEFFVFVADDNNTRLLTAKIRDTSVL